MGFVKKWFRGGGGGGKAPEMRLNRSESTVDRPAGLRTVYLRNKWGTEIATEVNPLYADLKKYDDFRREMFQKYTQSLQELASIVENAPGELSDIGKQLVSTLVNINARSKKQLSKIMGGKTAAQAFENATTRLNNYFVNKINANWDREEERLSNTLALRGINRNSTEAREERDDIRRARHFALQDFEFGFQGIKNQLANQELNTKLNYFNVLERKNNYDREDALREYGNARQGVQTKVSNKMLAKELYQSPQMTGAQLSSAYDAVGKAINSVMANDKAMEANYNAELASYQAKQNERPGWFQGLLGEIARPITSNIGRGVGNAINRGMSSLFGY